MQLGVLHHGVGPEQPRDRLPTGAEGLPHQDEVGVDAVPQLEREHLAAAPHAGLHLVEAEQPSPLLAHGAESVPERLTGGVDAALSEHRLDHHAGHLPGVHLLHEQVVLEVVEHRGVVERTRALDERRPEAVREGDGDDSRHVLRATCGDVREVAGQSRRKVRRLPVVLPTEGEDRGRPVASRISFTAPSTARVPVTEYSTRFSRPGAASTSASLNSRTGVLWNQPLICIPWRSQADSMATLTRSGVGPKGEGPCRHVVGERVAVDVDDQRTALGRLDERHDGVVGHRAGQVQVSAVEPLLAAGAGQRGDDVRQLVDDLDAVAVGGEGSRDLL